MSALKAVIRKELIDNLRDRRALMSALIFPIFGPVLFGVMFTVMAGWLRKDRPLDIAVAGQKNAPHLVQFLERYGAHVSEAPKDYEKQVKDGQLPVVVVVPAEFAKDFSHGQRAPVQVVSNDSRNETQETVQRTKRLLRAYSGEIGTLRLLARGVAPEIANPLDVQEIDVASSQEKAATLLNMIPLFILMAAFIGGMHVAIDTTAGERERGSLEPLLINPVSRWSLSLGKWLSAVLVSWFACCLCIGAFAYAVHHVPLQDLGIKAELGQPEIVNILLAALPVSLLSAGLMMVVASFARSFKEAQTYCTVLQFVPVVPGMMMVMSPMKPALWMMFVPVLGQTVLIDQAMRGENLHVLWFVIASAAVLVSAMACLGICVRLFRHEKIVFGR